MLQKKAFRYSLFALLYFAQGSILSYFAALNALYLRSFELSMSQIGLFSAIALTPFILKIFLGMLSDRVNLLGRGHRQPYIVLGLLLQVGGLVAFPLIHPVQQFGLLLGIAFLAMAGMALYDTCTDGLALDTTPKDEEGTVQGIMVAGRALGVVVVSAVLGLLAHLVDWNAVFWALAGITLLPLVLVLPAREPPRPAGRAFQWAAFRAFRRGPVLALGLLGALYSLIINGSNEIVNPFLEASYGITYLMAGFYTAVWGVGVVLGGLTGGRLTDRLGHRRAMTGALATALVAGLALALIYGPGPAWPIVFIFGLAYGYYETVYFAAAMDLTDRRIAAAMFAILMAVANVGTGIGLALAGALVDVLGYRWTFVAIATLNLLALPLMRPVFGPRNAPRS